MAEPHSIVVYVRAGKVQRVAFCECCPPVAVEIRAYDEADSSAAASTPPVEPMLPVRLEAGRWRDHEGTYNLRVYEPDFD